MDKTESLQSVLQALETELYQPAARSDRARIDALLHADFLEFGRSGRSYRKADILQLLPADSNANTVWAQDFAVRSLGDGFALLTYQSAHQRHDGSLERHALRSSVWQLTPEDWQLRFHQATPTESFTSIPDRTLYEPRRTLAQ
jgi:hypothetical protein